ncbi:helix-turn-helix domain-containing protein [Pseudolysinimonas yzui]|uniref:Schlafen AlbA-2 domain-containing protein n=1 Tax=Pseudolysinimonas yzui TaxID=2708254 RepID=A0A8J3GRU2_9MICO|nr:RNA-binding domain-containing protein [Pseudolysinimonas yzui]GHF22624.1 hypothetical protein GCM10011600_24700 [Pseudolysinimonas yzui]
MLSDEEIAAIIELGYEQRSIEFKAAGSRTDRRFLALIARAALALANQRDGGHLLIGLSEEGIDADSSGLSDEQVDEWLSYDDLSDQINSYADPPVAIQVQRRSLPNSRPIVVIEVAEFAEVPTLSKKDYPGVIANRSLYTRSMAKPESSASHSQNELREILNLATEKQLSRFIETARRGGLSFSGLPTDADAFGAQAASVQGGPTYFAVPEVEHALIEIHPSTFDPELIEYRALARSVRERAVSWRGWPFPFVRDPQRGDDWVGESVDTLDGIEVWQFFRSGLFVHYETIGTRPPDFGSAEGDRLLPIWMPLLHFTEALEFASRLQRAHWPESSTVVRVSLNNIEGRHLVAGRHRNPLHGQYVFNGEQWSREIVLTAEQALTSTRGNAVRLALDLVERFGWMRGSEDGFRAIQDEVFGRESA